MNVHPETKVMRIPELVAAQVGLDLVMFSFEQGRYFGLNEVGAAIWEAIEQPITIRQLCEHLRGHFQVDPERCLDDVSAFLSELTAKGMVVMPAESL